MVFIINGRIVANDTLKYLKLAHRKRSLDITLAGLKVDSHLTHGILKMDDPADQQRLTELFAMGDVHSVHQASAVSGFVLFIIIITGIFVGQLGQLLGSGQVLQIIRAIPTDYLADGIVNASQNTGSMGSNLLDIGIILGSTIVFLVISAWALRRQSTILAMI